MRQLFLRIPKIAYRLAIVANLGQGTWEGGYFDSCRGAT
jgi:hypothetical protein